MDKITIIRRGIIIAILIAVIISLLMSLVSVISIVYATKQYAATLDIRMLDMIQFMTPVAFSSAPVGVLSTISLVWVSKHIEW